MRTTCLCLVALLAALSVDAAPAPDSSKQKLAALKKKLPDVLTKFVIDHHGFWLTGRGYQGRPSCKPEVRVLRRIGSDRAKAVILFASYLDKERQSYADVVLTVFLSYYDGCWTTEKFEASSQFVDSKELHRVFPFLMMAIDDAAEK